MNLSNQITEEMKPFEVVVSQREGYLRMWNPYTGSIMGAFNRKLDEVCARHNLKCRRERTFGNGMTDASDWEDRLYSK